MKPSVKDTAEFYALALGFGLADCQEILRWGDKLLEQEAQPAAWVIDLVLVRSDSPADAVTALHSAPGTITGFAPTMMLLLRARSFCQQRRLDGERTGRMLYELLLLNLLPPEFEFDAHRIDDGYGLASSNILPKEDADAALVEFFDKLSAYEGLEMIEQ